MDYFDSVTSQTHRMIDRAVDRFFNTADRNRPTVVLLPGGMGSRLRRAWPAHNPASTANPTSFSTIWLDCGVIWAQDALKLTIDTGGFDLDRRIVVADREVDFFVDPYGRAIDTFDNWNFNVVVFGWDWRRHVLKGVAALEYLVTELRDGAQTRWNRAILDKLFLVGHSMGGMVAKLFMGHHAGLAAECGGVITVGTPFYGYFEHLGRFYYGDETFNTLYGALPAAQVVSSLPGLYSLLPIDLITWQDVGATIGLAAYPVTDKDTGNPVDPYGALATLRYPPWVRDTEIPIGLQVRHDLAAALPSTVAGKLFHLRADVPNSTQAAAVWRSDISPDYEPGDQPKPITFSKGGGDNTIPTWSARLASTPGTHVTDFDHGEHMFLMEDNHVLIRIREIINGILAGAIVVSPMIAQPEGGEGEREIAAAPAKTVRRSARQTASGDGKYYRASDEAVEALEKAVGEQPKLASKKEATDFIQKVKRGEFKPGQVYDRDYGEELVPPPIVRRLMQESGF